MDFTKREDVNYLMIWQDIHVPCDFNGTDIPRQKLELSHSGRSSLHKEGFLQSFLFVRGLGSEAGKQGDEGIRGCDGSFEKVPGHQRDKEGAGAGLAVEGAFGIEFDIGKAGEAVEDFKPVAMRVDGADIEPIVEDGFGLEREGEVFKLEANEGTGSGKARIALGGFRVGGKQVGEGSAALKDLAALKSAFQGDIARLTGMDFQMEGAEVAAYFSVRLRGNFEERSIAGGGGCCVEGLDILFFLDRRKAGIPHEGERDFPDHFRFGRSGNEDGAFSHGEDF